MPSLTWLNHELAKDNIILIYFENDRPKLLKEFADEKRLGKVKIFEGMDAAVRFAEVTGFEDYYIAQIV